MSENKRRTFELTPPVSEERQAVLEELYYYLDYIPTDCLIAFLPVVARHSCPPSEVRRRLRYRPGEGESAGAVLDRMEA